MKQGVVNVSTLQISDDLLEMIQREAEQRGLPVEDFLKSVVARERTLADRQKLEWEQEWWLNLPLGERANYEGEYVAIHDREVVDHDVDENALYKRVRAKYGSAPVSVIPAEGPREIRIYSPRLVRQ